ncbi:MAG TPA: VanW family protein [Candidatus Saccharimonadales bacterium]|nr:VanW family protein [Candidatus Saccharimonadales bacterium]
MTVTAKEARTYGVSRTPWKHLVAPLLAAAALAVLALGVDAAFAQRALPRVTVGGVEVGTLPASELRDRLVQEVARPWAAAQVVVHGPDGQEWTTTNELLAIAPDVDRAVAQALAYGHTGSPTQRIVAWIDALEGRAAVPFAMRVDGSAADEWVRMIVAAVDRPASDGAIVPTLLGIDVTPAVVGRSVDGSALRSALTASSTLGDRAIALQVHETYPAVDPSGIREAAAKAIAATTALTIVAGDRSTSEDAAGLATLLVIEKTVATPDDLDAIPAGASAPATRYIYRTRLDDARVAEWVSRLAALLDHPAQNATYAVQADGSLVVVPAVDGVKIDQQRLVTDVTAGLFTPVTAPREIVPVFVADAPVLTTEQATRYAPQMTQVATFTTTYPADAARHANITTGAMQFNDLVLAPGQSFSFWDLLGPVSVDRGYAFAGAIIEGKSDENVIGGGLCQVSTTLFNAVARAGFEIVERHAHGYYIDRYPIGFDAAVFEPGVDFKWKNDTQYPVLIKAYPYAAALRFDLISVPTGRRVEIGTPYEYNLTSPAPDQPADPAYLPGGVTLGRDVSRTWTVWQGDTVVHQETFFSHYVPVWGGPAR